MGVNTNQGSIKNIENLSYLQKLGIAKNLHEAEQFHGFDLTPEGIKLENYERVMRLARSARNKYSHELMTYSNMPSANPEITSGL